MARGTSSDASSPGWGSRPTAELSGRRRRGSRSVGTSEDGLCVANTQTQKLLFKNCGKTRVARHVSPWPFWRGPLRSGAGRCAFL